MSDVAPADDQRIVGGEEQSSDLVVADMSLLKLLRDRSLSGKKADELELIGVDFSGVDLQGVNLAKSRIEGCAFDNANLARALLSDAVIESTTFVGANLGNATMDRVELLWVDLSEANLEGIDFRNASLEEVTVSGAKLDNTAFDSPSVRFLDAESVIGMDVSEIADDELEPRIRLALHQHGAKAHSGFRCPRCLQWDGEFYGLDPTCSLCGAVGFVDFDPAARREELPLACPWCGGSGGFSYSMSSAGCLYCNGLGRLAEWVIDRNMYDDYISGDVYEYEDGIRYPSMSFSEVDFSEVWVVEGHMEDIAFTGCSFKDADFTTALLRDLRFVECDMTGANSTRARLESVSFTRCLFSRSNWSETLLDVVEAISCDFAQAIVAPGQLSAIAQIDRPQDYED